MKINIERSLSFSKYRYSIDIKTTCYAEANYTFGIGLRKITVIDNNKAVYILKQTNFGVKIITMLLFFILPNMSLPKFKFFDDGVIKGESNGAFFNPRRILKLDKHEYEVYLHSDNYISIMKDKKQIGLIKKNETVVASKNQYSIHYDENIEKDVRLIFLLTVFADVIYFPNKFRISYAKYEKTAGDDKLRERTFWKP